MQKHDTELGSLRLNVEEIARNKTMKDVWPLQQANKGDIELTLTFQPVIFEEDEAVRTLSSRCCLAISGCCTRLYPCMWLCPCMSAWIALWERLLS